MVGRLQCAGCLQGRVGWLSVAVVAASGVPGGPSRRRGHASQASAPGRRTRAKRGGQAEPVGQLTQQRRPVWPTTPSPSQVTSKRGRVLVACTRKVPSLAGEYDLGQPHSSSSGGLLRSQTDGISRHAKS
jgi:hypothetical protein